MSSIYGLGDPNEYFRMVLHLVKGDRLDQRELIARLTSMQYSRNDTELRRATYRVRGEVIDVHPAESEIEAVRIELFDGEIEGLSLFDPLTGEVYRKLQRFTLYPKSHYVTTRKTVLDAIETIKPELKDRLEYFYKENKLVEAQRLQQRTQFDLEMMNELGFCKGIENYTRHLSGRAPGEPPGDRPAASLAGLNEKSTVRISGVPVGKVAKIHLGKTGKGAIVDLDENFNPVWVWSTFDNLDPERHPYEFCAASGYDWTHCNAVLQAPDGNLLLSSRHQNWVMKLRYAGGGGDGTILWKLGYEGDFTLSGGDVTQWFFAQHFPHILAATDTQITSLSVFDNGNDRCYATAGGCEATSPPPAPWSLSRSARCSRRCDRRRERCRG